MADSAVKDTDKLNMADDDLPDFEVVEDPSLAGKSEQMRFESPQDDDEDEGHADGGPVEEERDARLNADDDSEDDRRRSRQDKKRIRQLAKERDRLKIEALEREVQEMRSGTQQMMERIHSQDTYIVEQRYNEAAEYKRRADFAYDQAAAKQDAAAMSEARRHQEAANAAVMQLRDLHGRLRQNVPQQRPPAPDPIIRAKASKFIQDRAPWYNPAAEDADSRVMAAIDVKLSSEGYDPRTDEYWSELERRAASQLPERFRGFKKMERRMAREDHDDDDDGRRRDAPVGVGSNGARQSRNGSGKVVVRLSPERVRALQETGEWDDPKARARAIRDYQKFDQESRSARR